MKGRCKTEIVIVVGLLMLAAGISLGIFFVGTSRAGIDHLAPIPAAIVTGFLGFLGGRYTGRNESQPPVERDSADSRPTGSEGP